MKQLMKRAASVVAMVAILAMTTAVPARAAAAYVDVPSGYWATDYIAYAQANGIMNGMGDGRFAPEDTLVMSQVCQILFNLSGQTVNTSISPWYAQAVSYVEQQAGLLIDPGDICTRVTICRLIYRMANDRSSNYYGYNNYFSDTANLDYEGQTAINYCVNRGIVAGMGDDRFNPNGYLTRAQAAKIFSLYSTSSTGYVTPGQPTTTPTQQSANASLAQMVTAALNAGFYAEASGQNLLVYTPDGYYTYSLNGGSWSMRASNGKTESIDASFIQRWLSETSRKYTDAQKVSTAKTEIFERLESWGFMPELLGSYGNGSTITFDPFGGVSVAYVPVAASNYAGSTTLSLSNGALLIQGYQNMSISDYLATMQGVASRLSGAEKVALATAYVSNLCYAKGWTMQSEALSGSSVRLKCYPAGRGSYYVFVIGASGSQITWSNEANGQSRSITRDSVKMVIR